MRLITRRSEHGTLLFICAVFISSSAMHGGTLLSAFHCFSLASACLHVFPHAQPLCFGVFHLKGVPSVVSQGAEGRPPGSSLGCVLRGRGKVRGTANYGNSWLLVVVFVEIGTGFFRDPCIMLSFMKAVPGRGRHPTFL